MTVRISNYGGVIVSIEAPGRDGKKADVVLGYTDSRRLRRRTRSFLGCLVGRYGNRIAKGEFTLDGKTLRPRHEQRAEPPPRRARRASHGSGLGSAEGGRGPDGEALELTLREQGRRGGLPGHADGHGRLLPAARTAGSRSTTRRRPTQADGRQPHEPRLLQPGRRGRGRHPRPRAADRGRPRSRRWTRPSSRPASCGRSTARRSTSASPRAIGARIDAADEQIKRGGGYDHNFVLRRTRRATLRLVVRVHEPKSGRVLEVLTTEPGDPVLHRQLPRRHDRRASPASPTRSRSAASASRRSTTRTRRTSRSSRRSCSGRARPTTDHRLSASAVAQ